MREPPRGSVWAVLLATGTAYELRQLRSARQDTFSAFARWALRVDTRLGHAAFVLGWRLFAMWFEDHIVRVEAKIIEALEP